MKSSCWGCALAEINIQKISRSDRKHHQLRNSFNVSTSSLHVAQKMNYVQVSKSDSLGSWCAWHSIHLFRAIFERLNNGAVLCVLMSAIDTFGRNQLTQFGGIIYHYTLCFRISSTNLYLCAGKTNIRMKLYQRVWCTCSKGVCDGVGLFLNNLIFISTWWEWWWWCTYKFK